RSSKFGLVIALDPEWAARRYATAVRERNVIGYLNDDGTATVTGSALPLEQAATACAHVEELARATKRAGHPGRIGPLRADIYLGLLDGSWHHATRDQIITDLLTRATDHDAGPADSDHPAGPSARDDIPAGGASGDARADSSSMVVMMTARELARMWNPAWAASPQRSQRGGWG
ncbi:MAG: hypothetical protein DLM61_16440, partial [Pseudonocardiales bacterium]